MPEPESEAEASRTTEVGEPAGDPAEGVGTLGGAGPTRAQPRASLADARKPLARGDEVGRYVVLERLGVGGMGEVYAAYDPELDRKIAIKLLLASPGGTQATTGGHGRLLREAQAMAKLRHPNVVAVHDVGTHGDRVFVAMEFVDGGDLDDWLEAGRTGTGTGTGTGHGWELIRDRFVAAGEGLAAAHDAGLIHRDFKPANVLVGSDGAIRVADFGLARRTHLDEVRGEQPVADAVPARQASLDPRETRPSPFSSAAPASGRAPPDPDSGALDTTLALDGATLLAAADARPTRPGTHAGARLGAQSGARLGASAGDSLSLRMTATGATLGTPAYMAPEQYGGEREVDARADQFSFCVAVWEALYGQRPYPGDNLHALMFAIHEGRLREPPSDSEVPAVIRRALTRGLAPDPQRRWPDMRALLVELRFDPHARRRKLLGVGLGLTLVAGLAWGVVASRPDPIIEAPACTGAAAAFGDALTDARRAAVAERFAGFEQAWARDLGERLLPSLDGWAQAWQRAWIDACEATHVRGEQSSDLLDRRLACLERQRRGFVEVVDGLASADEALARKADVLLDELGSIAACSDADALLRITPLPADPAVVAQIQETDAALSEAYGMYLAGGRDEAAAALERVSAQVTQLDYAPLSAQAEHLRGRLHGSNDAFEAAEQALERAFNLALEAGDDRFAAKIARSLAHDLQLNDRVADARRWLDISAALGERIGDDRLRVSVAITRSQVLQKAGDYPGAEAAAQTGYDLMMAIDPDSALVGDTLYLLGLAAYRDGRYAETIDLLERARVAWRSDIGPRHPRTSAALGLLGGTVHALGDYARAEAYFREAYAIQLDTFGPGKIESTTHMMNLANVLGDRGEYDEAIDLFEQVLAIRRATPDASAVWTGRTLVNLAETQRKAGRLDDASESLDAGEALVREALGDEHPDLIVLFHIRAALERDRGNLEIAERYASDAWARAVAEFGPDNPQLFELATLAAEVALARGRVKLAGERLAASPPADAVETSERHEGERAFVEARYHTAIGDDHAVTAALARAEQAFERDGAGSAAKLAELRAWTRARDPER